VPTRFYLSNRDRTDHTLGTVCQKVSELESEFKAGYYLWKAFQWIRGVRFPVPE